MQPTQRPSIEEGVYVLKNIPEAFQQNAGLLCVNDIIKRKTEEPARCLMCVTFQYSCRDVKKKKKKDNTRIGEGGQLNKDGLVRMGSHDLCLVHYR